jgi:hypothetical protein
MNDFVELQLEVRGETISKLLVSDGDIEIWVNKQIVRYNGEECPCGFDLGECVDLEMLEMVAGEFGLI